jgi:hypothetical protein
MRITWTGYNIKWQDGRPTSSAASVRYRMLIPAEALHARDHEVKLLQLGLDSDLGDVLNAAAGDALVLSKLSTSAVAFERMAAFMLELMRRARAGGTRVLVDVSDDHFDDPLRGGYFARAVNECDGVVASTPSMAEIVRRRTERPIRVIGDPYEGPARAPRLDPPAPPPSGLLAQVLGSLVSGRSRPLRLLWFGHESNFESLVSLIPRLRALTRRYAIELHAVTSPHPEIVGLCERISRDNAPALTLHFSAWSTEATWRALEACDLVVIPSQLDDHAKAVKSPNRVIESIRAGRFVCANPVPSYQEFGEFAWIGEDIASGVEWAVRNAPAAVQKLGAGQEHVTRHYAPEAIARQWEAAFMERYAT